jgi:hypothetical protein
MTVLDEAKAIVHDLKCHPEPFSALWSGIKRFEYRNDRNYQPGDILRLREFVPQVGDTDDGEYTGRSLELRVSYVLYEGYGLPEGYVILSLRSDGYDNYQFIQDDGLDDLRLDRDLHKEYEMHLRVLLGETETALEAMRKERDEAVADRDLNLGGFMDERASYKSRQHTLTTKLAIEQAAVSAWMRYAEAVADGMPWEPNLRVRFDAAVKASKL